MTSDPFLWHPSPEVQERARLSAFLKQCGLDSFEALRRRSIEDIGWFSLGGAGIGAALFAATNSPIWIAIGAGVGVAVGAAIRARSN